MDFCGFVGVALYCHDYPGICTTASTSTRNSGRTSPATMTVELAGGLLGKVSGAHFAEGTVVIDVGEEGGDFHHVRHGGTGGLDYSADAGHDVPGLGLAVADAHGFAVVILGHLAGDE